MSLAFVLLFCSSAFAQEEKRPPPNVAAPVPSPAPPRATTLNIQLKTGQKALIDSIQGALLEKQTSWALIITGAKGKSVFTCELRHQSTFVLLQIMQTLLTAHEVTVSCLNADTSTRGGALVDLDNPKTGSFVMGAVR